MNVDWKEMDVRQAFNRGCACRELGLPIDAVILEKEDKETWLKGWDYQDKEAKLPPIWKLALPE